MSPLPLFKLCVNTDIAHRSNQHGKGQGKKCTSTYLGPAQGKASQPVYYQRQYRGQSTGQNGKKGILC